MKKEIGISILLVVLCVVTTIMNHAFIGRENLTNLANTIGMYGIFSIGMGLVIITGGIDLSVGSMCALVGRFAGDGADKMALALARWQPRWRWPSWFPMACWVWFTVS